MTSAVSNTVRFTPSLRFGNCTSYGNARKDAYGPDAREIGVH